MKRLSIVFYFLASFIATGAIVFFIVLPIRFNSSLWQGYRILVVPTGTSKEVILQAGKAADITGIISEHSIPNRFSFLETQHYNGFPFTSVEQYRQWFENTTASLCYLYIPYTSLWKFIKFYSILYISIKDFYLEPALPYAFFQLFICSILFCYCILYTKKRTLFFSAAISFLWYAACTRDSFVFTAALLSILSAAYWIEALGNETVILWKQLKTRIQQNRLMFILPAISVIFALLAGKQSFFFFFLATLLSISLSFSLYNFLQLQADSKAKNRLHPQLEILAMHPQSWYRFWNTPYALRTSILTTVLLLIPIIFPLFFSWNRLNKNIHTVTVPAPVSYTKRAFNDDSYFSACAARPISYLPDLGSYIEDHWYATVFPYMNVHDPFTPISKGTQVRFTFFTEQQGGKLESTEKILYTFNDAFIKTILQDKQLRALPLETMLYAQGGFIAAAYTEKTLFALHKLITFIVTLGALFFPSTLIMMARTQ